MASACAEGGNIPRARMLSVTTGERKIGKESSELVRDASAPFHHDNAVHRGRHIETHAINGHYVSFKYPHPPTEAEQIELLKLSAIACSCCLPHEMERGDCHAVWLVDKLRKKFRWHHGPDLISAAIPPEMIAQATKEDNWKHAREIHRHAFVVRKACHVSHMRGGTNVPRLIPGVKLGISRFGNPFASLPLRQSRALFEHYVDNDFQPLSNATVQAILLETDSAMPTGR